MTSLLRNPLLVVILLPVFFVFKGYLDNHPIVPPGEATVLLGKYLLGSLLFYAMFCFFYKDRRKAGLATFAVMCLQFFFGSLHDSLKAFFGTSFPARYSVLIPLLAIILLAFLFMLKKKTWQLGRVITYLNLLLLVVLVMEVVSLGLLFARNKKEKLLANELQFSVCRDCPKPDIYLIISDAYSGNAVLDTLFDFPNTKFTNELKQRGFHLVPNATANYNYTVFSIASLLNMDYLRGVQGNYKDKQDLRNCFSAIRKNRLLDFLDSHDYSFHNYSLFDFHDNPAIGSETFIPGAGDLVSSQTFTRRVEKDLAFHLFSNARLGKAAKRIYFRHYKKSMQLLEGTKEAVKDERDQPKFVYTHVLMPHFPYYFNSKGEPYDWKTGMQFNNDKERYIEYLQYSNSIFLDLIDSILLNAASPPVIVLAGDHGFRQYKEPVSNEVLCSNFNAVLLPGGDYTGFRDGLSSVNQFRVILNNQFRQDLPMLEDSTIFIRAEEID